MRIFELALERVRLRFNNLCVYGYVVMPEHVHLLIGEPVGAQFKPPGSPASDICSLGWKPSVGLSGEVIPRTLADAIKSLKQGVSRRLIGEAEHFWQKRYYDFNVRNRQQFVEKLRYIHRNPVKRGLYEHPEDWEWSSFRHYATGLEGRVEIESEWVSRKRERAAGKLCPAVELVPHSSQNKA